MYGFPLFLVKCIVLPIISLLLSRHSASGTHLISGLWDFVLPHSCLLSSGKVIVDCCCCSTSGFLALFYSSTHSARPFSIFVWLRCVCSCSRKVCVPAPEADSHVLLEGSGDILHILRCPSGSMRSSELTGSFSDSCLMERSVLVSLDFNAWMLFLESALSK